MAAVAVITAAQAFQKSREDSRRNKIARDTTAREMQTNRKEGQQAEAATRLENRRKLASQRVAMSGSGIEYTTGSFAAVTEDREISLELEALGVRYNTELKNTRFQDQWNSSNFNQKIARRDGVVNAGKSLLTIAGNQLTDQSSSGGKV